MNCPECNSGNIRKNGFIHNGKQKYQCKDCGRQFVLNPKYRRISQETLDLVDKLLLEKISLAGIARVTGVSETWLQTYVNKKYDNIPKKVKIKKKTKVS